MNGRAARVGRKELRRAIGADAVKAFSETAQQTRGTMTALIGLELLRYDEDAKGWDVDPAARAFLALRHASLWGRLRWLATGRA